MPVIWDDDKADYFSSEDWTGQISLIRHDKSDFRRIGKSTGFRWRDPVRRFGLPQPIKFPGVSGMTLVGSEADSGRRGISCESTLCANT